MASIINASSSGSGGIVQTADASGVLQLQANGTVAITVNSNAVISVPTSLQVTGTTTPSSGAGVEVLYTSSTPWLGSSGQGVIQAYDRSGSAYKPMAIQGSTVYIPISGVASSLFNQYGLGLGATTPTSGVGITFPATQSSSSNPNTLDDYEEGTWTPRFEGLGSNPTVTYSNQYGYYRKVGSIVYCTLRMTINTTSGGGGQLVIRGMPFSIASATQLFSVVNIGYGSAFTTAMPTFGRWYYATDYLELYYRNTATTEAGIQISYIQAGTDLILDFTYISA